MKRKSFGWQMAVGLVILLCINGCHKEVPSLAAVPSTVQDLSPQAVALQAFCTEITENNMAAAATFVAGGEADPSAPSRFPSLLQRADLKISHVQLTPAGFTTDVDFTLSFGESSTGPHERDREEAVTMVNTPAGWKIFPPHTVSREPNRMIAIAAYELTPEAVQSTKDSLEKGLKAIAAGMQAYLKAHGGMLPASEVTAGTDLLPYLKTGPLALNPSEEVPAQVVYASSDGKQRVQSTFGFNTDLAGKKWKSSSTPMFYVGTAKHPFLVGPFIGCLTEAGRVVWVKNST